MTQFIITGAALAALALSACDEPENTVSSERDAQAANGLERREQGSANVGDLTPNHDTPAEAEDRREGEIKELMDAGMTRAEAEAAWEGPESEAKIDSEDPGWGTLPENSSVDFDKNE